MKILYIGAGYVGVCSAAVAADSGHNVLIYDIDREKIKLLSTLERKGIEECLFEDGLGDLMVKNKERLNFTHTLDGVKDMVNGEAKGAVDEVEAVFMCLPTPEKGETGETDLSYYETAVESLARVLVERNNGAQSQYVLIVNKSTVPFGMHKKTRKILEEFGVRNFGVGSNPEFLVEGKAVEGSLRPNRVVVGAVSSVDFRIFRNIYSRFVESPSTSYIEVGPEEAEAGKLLANFTLFYRLSLCFDIVGRVCEKFENLRFENIRKILISDKRISKWGFYDSLFAGGSCFIKDARSLSFQLKDTGASVDLVDDTLKANFRQIDNFLKRPEKELDFNWENKKIGILGLAFKRDTDDIRYSSSVYVTEFLLKKGVKEIKCFDPVAGKNFKKHFDQEKIVLVDAEIDAIKEMDAIIISTDWPQFRELYNIINKYLPKNALIMDGRRMLQHKYHELKNAGYDIIAVGSPLIKRV